MEARPERNHVCTCGSMKKYKNCCMRKHEEEAIKINERKEELDSKPLPKHWLRRLFGSSSFIVKPRFRLNVIRKMEYRDILVCVFQYQTMFQYLFAYKGEIFQDHLFLKPTLRNRFLHLFGKPLYSKQDLDYGEQVALSGAMRSLDALQAKPFNADPVPENK